MENNKKLRICIDLDGTICEIRKVGESYSDILPKKGVKEIIDNLKKNGHIIVIYTARNMNTQGHNIGKVLKNVGKVTLDWLEKYQIQYDEIFFGKPNADLIIDDRCIRFEDWDKIDEDLIKRLSKSE